MQDGNECDLPHYANVLTQSRLPLDPELDESIVTTFLIGQVNEFAREEGEYFGFKVQQWSRHDLRGDIGDENFDQTAETGDDPEQVYGDRSLFAKCYRTKRCTRCGQEKLATLFDWKIRGVEGPFRQLWGRRDAYCKPCRSIKKALRYSEQRRKTLAIRKRRSSTTIWDMSQVIAEPTFTPFEDGDMSVLRDLAERLTFG